MPKHTLRALSVAVLAGTCLTSTAQAGPDPFMAQIVSVGENFCPRGYMHADGRLLPIAQYTALFSLMGTTFGGDGRTTFALPDLRGRSPIHLGTGPGLPTYTYGERGGNYEYVIPHAALPSHTHTARGTTTIRSTGNPSGAALGTFPNATFDIYSDAPATLQMNNGVVGSRGSSTPYLSYQPSQVIRFCVAVQGIFPSRN